MPSKIHAKKVHGKFIPYKVEVSEKREWLGGKNIEGQKWIQYITTVMRKMKVGTSFECFKKDKKRIMDARDILKAEDLPVTYKITEMGAKDDHILVFKFAK